MKKVININFQGRVIPIEETAYEMLQNYINSLRAYFANEEGRDEIINDIENRIGELFDERLKKGSACIMDADVAHIMTSMGRPEDFEREDEPTTRTQSEGYKGAGSVPPSFTESIGNKKRLYRDEQDKILGGVASGLAHYLNIDPAIIRILFAVLAFFGGSGFLIYIILWIVLPSRSLVTNIRKRLYRDTEDRVISGVCGGLAKYFDINPAIPRIIFAAPFIFGIITSVGRSFFDSGSVFAGSFGGGTFILVYIILWIVLPEAFTSSEKLEMRGEKVDLNSIRNTVMGDLQGVKGRAEKMGSELKGSAQRLASEARETFGTATSSMSSAASTVASDTSSAVRRSSTGLGHAIAILIKAFVYFIGGIIAFGLFVALIALLGSGVSVLPLREFVLQGTPQYFFAWGTLLLFIGIPIIALLVWFIRRLMRVNTHNKYIGYSFSALWFVGLFCLIALIASLSRNFSSQVGKAEDVSITQPNGTMVVEVGKSTISYYDSWIDFDGMISADQDSLFLNTARINVIRSKDSLYHLHLVKISRGYDRQQSQRLAEKINFPITQSDSVIYLPSSFAVSKNEKWRNQRVMVVIEVPLGKKIRLDDRVHRYDYFNIEFGGRRNYRDDYDNDWEDGEWWSVNEDLTMTPNGLKSDNQIREDAEDKKNEEEENAIPTPPVVPPVNSKDSVNKDTVYRYNGAAFDIMPSTPESNQASENDEAAVHTQYTMPSKTNMSLNVSPLAALFRM
jgi:phage shock protein PspC (stress-responsive transcriptional regulator)